MAVIEIARGSTGKQESIEQIEKMLESGMKQMLCKKSLTSAKELYDNEQRNQEWGRWIGDLLTARQLLQTQMDEDFSEECFSEVKSVFGKKNKVEKEGLRRVELHFLGGNKLRLETPYMRVRGEEAKKKRGKAGMGSYPILRKLGMEDWLTPALRLEVAREVVSADSYQEAADELKRRGISFDKNQVGQIAVSTGTKTLEMRKERLSEAKKEKLPPVSSFKGKTVRISVDGGKAKTRKQSGPPDAPVGKNGRRPFELEWREPRIITIDVLAKKGKADRRFMPIYETTLDNANQTFDVLLGTLRLLGIHQAKKVLFIADGAGWLHERASDALLQAGISPEKIFRALDYYHATEKIYEALSVCSEFDDSHKKTLFHQLKKLLKKHDGAQKVIQQLKLLAKGRRARTINKKIAYLQKRIHLMDYFLLIKQHLSIGSGVVESAVRRVINLRFKSASISWKPNHLAPLLYLRAILKSDRWSQFIPAFLSSKHYLQPNLPLSSKTPFNSAFHKFALPL